jgi:hypothetical protein
MKVNQHVLNHAGTLAGKVSIDYATDCGEPTIVNEATSELKSLSDNIGFSK